MLGKSLQPEENLAQRPGDPETRKPGNPETRRPRDPETRRQWGKQPTHLLTKPNSNPFKARTAEFLRQA